MNLIKKLSKNIYVNLTLITGILLLLSFSKKSIFVDSDSKYVNDSIEKELLILKNQAFNDFYRLITKNEKCLPQDGTSYIQISNLSISYFHDKNLKRILLKWQIKEYNSFDKSNKLYLMKSLDFYNSYELKNYIDSVRIVEYKKLKQ